MSKPLYQTGIIKQLANKYNLPEEEVAKAVYHQFKFVSKTMKRGLFESVRLRRFGRFHVNPNRVKKLNARRSNTNE
ncbi:MAG TPA: HU family DNA-binding protein [Tissierellaceae bacterium]|nr:HU family DNA-binding protein [Tissierellaceae bacterium]